jgi:hypothetical protein
MMWYTGVAQAFFENLEQSNELSDKEEDYDSDDSN